MNLLLDTHALLWFAEEPERLSRRARTLIEDEDNVVLVSAVSAFEIATKYRLGKLPRSGVLAAGFEGEVKSRDFQLVAISATHGRLAGTLTADHRDPFDRLLAAQSIVEGVPLVSCDTALDAFALNRLW